MDDKRIFFKLTFFCDCCSHIWTGSFIFQILSQCKNIIKLRMALLQVSLCDLFRKKWLYGGLIGYTVRVLRKQSGCADIEVAVFLLEEAVRHLRRGRQRAGLGVRSPRFKSHRCHFSSRPPGKALHLSVVLFPQKKKNNNKILPVRLHQVWGD